MKILVVFTGGTIGSIKRDGVIFNGDNPPYVLLEKYKGKVGTEFITAAPYTILSENLSGSRLNLLYNCIKEKTERERPDGVIVTHGTDTLQYSASFISYAFGLCELPIVFVSANYPLESEKSNGFDNFGAAVDFIASRQGRGVFISYKNGGENAKIHRASRVLRHIEYDDKIFSADGKYYGEFQNGAFYKNPEYSELEDENAFEGVPVLSDVSPVLKIIPYVGMRYPSLGEKTEAVLFESWHSGTLGTDSPELKNFSAEAAKKGVPLFLTGNRSGYFYESKKSFESLGIKLLPPCSSVSAYIKLWIICLNKLDIYAAFSKSAGGDLLEK